MGRLGAVTALGLGLAIVAGCAEHRPPAPIPAATRAPAPADEDARPAGLDAIFRASVQIRLDRHGEAFRWGSGVIVAGPAASTGECLVLTAGHTLARLKEGDEIFALLDRREPEAVKVPAEIVAAQDNDTWDLAVLRIRNRDCAAARTGQPPSLGDAIWVVGFPQGGEMTIGRGIVSQLTRGKPGTPARFTVDASTSHGSSGAGVFDARTGRLIGVVEAFGTARVMIRGDGASPHIDIPMPGMTYVTPVSRAAEFLQAAVSGTLVVGKK